MLPALSLGFLLSSPLQTMTAELYRGSTVGDHRYWAVEDTFLDSTEADRAEGGLFTLLGGKGRTVLIKFGDLERALPWQAKVSKATLYLTPSSSEKPEFVGAGAVQAPWGEGSMLVVGAPETEAARGAATWKQRRAGDSGAAWQQAGATGPQDVQAIQGAQMEIQGTEIAITGLAQTVQKMRDHWYDNDGFALTFSGSCEFFSSQAKLGKPRLVIEWTLDSAIAGPDLSVQWIDRSPEKPKDGEEVTYRAAVKNVGLTAAKPFSGRWVIGEREGGSFEIAKALGPGEQTTVETKKIFHPNASDHRMQPVAFRIDPGENDTEPNDDAVCIDENAIPVAFVGDHVESVDKLQQLLRTINDTYFAQSRFSFAREGVKERLRLVPDAANAEFTVSPKENATLRETVAAIVSKLTGLDPVEQSPEVVYENRHIPYSDLYPGVSGFGDTRYDGLIPSGIPMLYVPVPSPLFDARPIEPTDLLCATEVAAVNMAIGKTGASRDGVLWDLPSTIILRAQDMTGKPLDGAELSFFQLDKGQMPGAPTQTILTKEGGTVILENRAVPDAPDDKDAAHHLKKNPFGVLKPDGSNGTILIRASINGEVEWSWLKAWQLADSYHRGNKDAAIVDVRFNAPGGPLDRTTDLAKGRLVTDSLGSLPAKLAPLTDGDLATNAPIGDKKGDWIEIDLGRDRPIGEVRLVFKNPQMPSQFDIQVYATGQQAPDTEAWVKDLDFKWTLANRAVHEADDAVAIPYRGPITRSRYIRIVNRSGGPGNIAEVRVVPLKVD